MPREQILPEALLSLVPTPVQWQQSLQVEQNALVFLISIRGSSGQIERLQAPEAIR